MKPELRSLLETIAALKSISSKISKTQFKKSTMIAYLKGQIIYKNKNSIILLSNSIGYEVHLTGRLIDPLEINQEAEFYIYTKVREDELSLFGFASPAELDFFKSLISVNGVGPKTALEILSVDADLVKSAIIQENASYLSKIPGIGKKTAERIILELKNKISPELNKSLPNTIDQQFEEVISALSSLGYQRGEILKVLKDTPQTLSTTEEMVTYFLQNI